MKILYISHYYEKTGFGQANKNFLLAMDKVGLDVIPRAIKLGRPGEIPNRIKELEEKDPSGCDVCIQYVLPHFLSYSGLFRKNISIFMNEHNGIKYTPWISYLNLMDEIWVHSQENKMYAVENGIRKPVFIVPIPMDLDELEQEYEPLKIDKLNGNFTFYFIGDLHRRKHLSAILRSFHSEFSTYEPVSLLIKLSGAPEQQLIEEFEKISKMVKSGLRMYQDERLYKNEVLMVENLTRKDILRLHSTCDCNLVPSFGESWNMVVFDAAALGKFPIITNCGGMRDYILEGVNGCMVDCYRETIIGMEENSFPGIHTAREWWWNVNSEELRRLMRWVYENKNIIKTNAKNEGLKIARNYSFEVIGEQIKGLLDADSNKSNN